MKLVIVAVAFALPHIGRVIQRTPLLPRGTIIILLCAFTMELLSGLCPARAASTNSAVFRVMTYNIHHGEGMDKKVDLSRIAALIKAEQADIVALQEVDKGTERTARRDFPAEFAELTGMTCVFSNNYAYQGGEYGNALLTRFPIITVTNSHFQMAGAGEQRGILQVVLSVQGKQLVVMNTHLDFRTDDADRLSSVKEILRLMKLYREKPILLCGDFNDIPSSQTHALISEAFRDSWKEVGIGNGFTIPSTKPTKRIDYIWLSNESPLAPGTMRVPGTLASDHLPVVAELKWVSAD